MLTLSKFWRIILSYKWGLLIQFAVFIGITLAFATFINDAEVIDEFRSITNEEIAIFDRDQTRISEALIAYLGELHDIVPIEDSDEAWHDAIMFTSMRVILEIPAGFGDSFLNGYDDVQLEYLVAQQQAAPFFINGQIERYFGILRTYLTGGFELDEALRLTEESLTNGVEIQIIEDRTVGGGAVYIYFRFLPISLLISVTLTVGGVFLALNKQDLIRRIESSPVSVRRRTLERIGSCLTFSLAAWVVFIVAAFIMFTDGMGNLENILRIVNSLPLVLLGIALAFIITQFINKRELLFQVAFSVIFLLAMPAGIMFDLWMLGEELLRIVRFTPLYWYARVNDMMFLEATIDWGLFWQGFIIQIAFAVAIFAVGMVLNKERRAKRA